MRTFIIRDVRLEGWRPDGNDVLEVDSNTPLQWVFSSIKSRSDIHGSNNLLVKFMCHGLPGYLQFANGGYNHPELGSYDGNGINFNMLNRFDEIKGKIKKLELRSCLVARMGACPDTNSLGVTTVFDGNIFCSNLAQTLRSEVQASIHLQWYWTNNGSNAMEIGGWNGRVFTWNSDGSIKKMEDFPYKFYLDPDPSKTAANRLTGKFLKGVR